MWGCLIMNTTNDKPVGLENVTPLPYNFTSDLAAFQGKVMIGETPLQRLQFYAEIASFGFKALTDLIENLTPIASIKEFITQVGRCVSRADKPCDPMAVLLAGASVIVDTAATVFVVAKAGAIALKTFKPLYKVGVGIERTLQAASRAGVAIGETASEVALIFRELSQEAISRGATTLQATRDYIARVMGTGIQKVSGCVHSCGKSLELVFKNMKSTFNDVRLTIARKTESYINGLVDRFDLQCILKVASEIITPDTLMDLGGITILFFGVTPNTNQTPQQRIGARPRAATSTSKCPVDQLRVNMNPKTTPLTTGAKDRINNKYGGGVTDNIYEGIPDADFKDGVRSSKPEGTSPHHITPKKEFEAARCVNASGDNICQGSRDILDRYGMDYNDGCNGSFLPYKSTSKAYSTFPNAQIHNRTDFHDLKYYERLFDILTAAEDEWQDASKPATFVPVANRKAKLCEELQVISYRLLTNQFYGNALR
jgi:hypothetical protein